MTLRIGNGIDVHAFMEGVPLVLGGVTIPYNRGLRAHSDGDVVIHALCDAILGALAKGDIGQHFPDTSNQYRGIDSRILLRNVVKIMNQDGYGIGNADLTVVAQAPKLAPYIIAMRKNLAEDLLTLIENVSIKATTSERLGFTGREEGIACLANVLLIKI